MTGTDFRLILIQKIKHFDLIQSGGKPVCFWADVADGWTKMDLCSFEWANSE